MWEGKWGQSAFDEKKQRSSWYAGSMRKIRVRQFRRLGLKTAWRSSSQAAKSAGERSRRTCKNTLTPLWLLYTYGLAAIVSRPVPPTPPGPATLHTPPIRGGTRTCGASQARRTGCGSYRRHSTPAPGRSQHGSRKKNLVVGMGACIACIMLARTGGGSFVGSRTRGVVWLQRCAGPGSPNHRE